MPLIQVSEIKVPTVIHIYCPCVRDILYIPKAEILSHHWSAWPVLTILWLRDQLDDTLQFYNWADEFNMHSKYAFNMHSEHIGTTPLPKTSMGCLREGVATLSIYIYMQCNLYICSSLDKLLPPWLKKINFVMWCTGCEHHESLNTKYPFRFLKYPLNCPLHRASKKKSPFTLEIKCIQGLLPLHLKLVPLSLKPKIALET